MGIDEELVHRCADPNCGAAIACVLCGKPSGLLKALRLAEQRELDACAEADQLRAEVANAREGHIYYRSKTSEFMGANLELSNAVARLTTELDEARGALGEVIRWWGRHSGSCCRGKSGGIFITAESCTCDLRWRRARMAVGWWPDEPDAAPKPSEPEEGGDG